MADDWRSHAACQGADAEIFFGPDREREPHKSLREEDAKAICRTCPAVEQCLAWAINNGATDGTWGGLTETERRPMHRRVQAARR